MFSQCSLYQLSSEIDNVFSAFSQQYPFGEGKVSEIKQAVLSGTYVFSPLKFLVLPNDYPRTNFFHVFSVPDLPNVYFAVLAESEDNLVFIALSRVLSLTFDSYSLENSFAFRTAKEGRKGFYGEVLKWGQVGMLLHFDLTPSLNTLSRSRLLAKLEPVLNDPSIFRLVSSFFELPILDEDGRDWSAETGVPSAGLLACVLLNFYLDSFDRTFINRFPHLPFVRYVHEIILAIPLNNQDFLSRRSKIS